MATGVCGRGMESGHRTRFSAGRKLGAEVKSRWSLHRQLPWKGCDGCHEHRTFVRGGACVLLVGTQNNDRGIGILSTISSPRATKKGKGCPMSRWGLRNLPGKVRGLGGHYTGSFHERDATAVMNTARSCMSRPGTIGAFGGSLDHFITQGHQERQRVSDEPMGG
jgi:hypothetical protein